ncbi:MAG: hypothetical protein ACI8P3_002946 [Saprospiraceae bacterium]|jgi:hypothetical protein
MKQALFLISLTLLLNLIFHDILSGQSTTRISKQTAPITDPQASDTIPPVQSSTNPKKETIFTVWEQLQYFPDIPDCAGISDTTSKMECFEKVLMEHIYKHLKYPELAKEHEIEGTVVVEMRIDSEDKIYCIKVIRDIGAGAGKAALAAVNLSLQELLKKYERCKWSPGKARGQPVSVNWYIPIKFKLKNKD